MGSVPVEKVPSERHHSTSWVKVRDRSVSSLTSLKVKKARL